jgi:serine/threonine-protein kinase
LPAKFREVRLDGNDADGTPLMSADWGPGTVVLGRYRLDCVLGRGGMGSVWRAEHLQLRSPIAIKLLDSSVAKHPQMLARFMREAQAAASLRSPHVVQILDYGVESGTAFIAMELLQGESLAARIARKKQLPWQETVRFIEQVLRAMSKAHERGIVHRDLKPDNIFICADEPEFAKVLDFGVAKLLDGDPAGGVSRTQTGMMIGTPYYMSPEQTQAKPVDPRADLWAVAVIAYECLVGRRPFVGDSLGELVIAICTGPVPVPSDEAQVPAGFDEWFVKGTQRDRERRFSSAREMVEELAELGLASAPARPAQTSTRPIAATLPRASSAPRGQAGLDRLALSTGQRAATSGSLQPVSKPRSAAAYLLIAAAVLIVLGVGAFVASGGASAFNRVLPGPPTAAAALIVGLPVAPANGSALSAAPASAAPVSAAPVSAAPASAAPASAALASAAPAPSTAPAPQAPQVANATDAPPPGASARDAAAPLARKVTPAQHPAELPAGRK